MPRGTVPPTKAKKGKTAAQCKSDMMGKNMKGIAAGKPKTKESRPFGY